MSRLPFGRIVPVAPALAVLLSVLALVVPAQAAAQTPSGLAHYSAVSARIALPGTNAYGIAIDPVNGDVYVTAFDGPTNGSLVAVSGATNAVVGTATVGWEPETPAVDFDTGAVYVPNLSPGVDGAGCPCWSPGPNVTVVSGATDSAIASVPMGESPAMVVYDPANGLLYVPSYGYFGSDWNVTVISGVTNRVVFNVSLGRGAPESGFYDAANGDVYFETAGNSTSPGFLTAVSSSTEEVVGTIALDGAMSGGLLLDESTGGLYAPGSNGIAVISSATNHILQSIPIAGAVSGFVDTEGNVGFLEPGSDAIVSIISGSSNSIQGSFRVGGASSMTYDPANGDLYTVQRYGMWGDVVNVTSLSSETLTQSLELTSPSTSSTQGELISAPLYDPGNGELYAIEEEPAMALVAISGNATVPAAGPANNELPLLEGLGLGATLGVVVMTGLVVILRRRKRA
jgi:DNA-binding beta-propeller fold protein YncE